METKKHLHTTRVVVGNIGNDVVIGIIQEEAVNGSAAVLLLAQMPFSRQPSPIEIPVLTEALRHISHYEHLDNGPQVTNEIIEQAAATFTSDPLKNGLVRQIGIVYNNARTSKTTLGYFTRTAPHLTISKDN